MMKYLKQFIEKLEWILLGLIIDIVFLFFDVFHEEYEGDSLFTLLLNGNYSLIFNDILYIVNVLVIIIITFYIVRAIPKLFIYEENYNIEDGLGYFFKYRNRYNMSKSFCWVLILFIIILIVSFLYMKYKYGL